MDPIKIIEKYYKKGDLNYEILLKHSLQVKEKALELADKVKLLNPNLKFVQEAAMLHDIGVFKTFAPDIGCTGTEKYIRHGILGREILEADGLPVHALVCERHVGVGISKTQIINENMPLPKRDMLPLTIEEKIITLADKFFSKNPKKQNKIFTLEDIRLEISKYGSESLERLNALIFLFYGKEA